MVHDLVGVVSYSASNFVGSAIFPNRSQAIQVAVQEKLARVHQGRPARECAKLDPAFEKVLAKAGLAEDESAWPAY